jgi:cytochrome c-type biogenesis protein
VATNVNLLTYADALAAGFINFASPCALALVPGYLSFITGLSYDELTSRDGALATRAGGVVRTTTAFVAGFAVLFALWGAGVGYLGSRLSGDQRTLNLISGGVLVLFGALMILTPRLGFLQGEKRITLTKRPSTLAGTAVAGAAFAIAWTPCTYPFLGQVLTLAAPTESPFLGATLLFTYALGLGVPFLLAGLFLTQTMSVSRRVRDHWRVITIVAGIVTIGIGILIASGGFTTLTEAISDIGWWD